jgi:micrococcal nuclease
MINHDGRKPSPMKGALFAFCLFVSIPSFAYKVIGIADGDTLLLLVDKKPLQIRLANVDAPEKSQPFGRVSRKSLSDICFGKEAYFNAQNVDRDGRTVAVVNCDGVEANRAQVKRGLAWVYRKYNNDLPLYAIEARAKKSRMGLWAAKSPIPPWEFRKQRKNNRRGSAALAKLADG